MTQPFDPTKPVRTRDGRPARIICTDKRSTNTDKAVVALVDQPEFSRESLEVYWPDGRQNNDFDRPDDLVNVPETMDVVLIVERNNSGHPFVHAHTLDREPNVISKDRFIARKIITVEIGEDPDASPEEPSPTIFYTPTPQEAEWCALRSHIQKEIEIYREAVAAFIGYDTPGGHTHRSYIEACRILAPLMDRAPTSGFRDDDKQGSDR